MKYIIIASLLLGGCTTFKKKHPHFSPVPIEKYDEEVLKENANNLNMRYVDYLHALTNGKISQLRSK
jgi:hypothetical protein